MNKFCEICGKSQACHTHHLIYGRGLRKLADQDNQTIDVCTRCHEEIHKDGVAGHLSKMYGQAMWEMDALCDGEDKYEVRNKFRERYGRSWL